MTILKFLAVLMSLTLTTMSVASVRDVSTLHITETDWLFVPTTSDLAVESFVALRTSTPVGQNITAVWYRKIDNVWASYAWNTQDQSRAIASVKLILNLADSTDHKWPVAPHSEAAEDPEKFETGVMESDPFASMISSMEEPELFVQVLEDTGWRAAWPRVWSHPCAATTVLDIWAAVVQVAEAEITENGGTNEIIEEFFAGSVAAPCGPDSYVCLIEMLSGAVLQTGDPTSLIIDGVVKNSDDELVLVRGAAIAEGQTIIHTLVANTGSDTVTLLVDDTTTVNVPPGAVMAVANTSTYNTCHRKCRRLVWDIYICHNPTITPRWVVDSKCFCKCWGCAQGDPGWLDNLPDCPCQITVNNGNPVNPDPDVWENPSPPSCCHPGAAWCMRGCPSVDGDPGQQCCYDANGQLITEGEGGGTPDIVAPCNWLGIPWWDAWNHLYEDVHPYNYCKSAGMLDCYLKRRPPNNGNGCNCNPPAHSNCGPDPVIPQNPCNCN